MKRRFLSLFLPYWSVERAALKLQRAHKISCNTPLLLTATISQQPIVKRCCPRSEGAGIKEGTSVALATALAPDAVIAPFDPKGDFEALYKIALRCLRFTPLVGVDTDLLHAFYEDSLERVERTATGIVLETTGTERYHHGEHELLKKILDRFAAHHITARAALASTLGAAWALSRYSTERVVVLPSSVSLRTALAPLPLPALRVSWRVTEALSELGIHSIGALLKLPTKTLVTRFGTELLDRIHQALGLVEERFIALAPKAPPAITKSFEIPLLRQQSVEIAVQRLFEKLLSIVALHGVMARSYVLRFEIINEQDTVEIFSKELTLNSASRNQRHLAAVIIPLLERLPVKGGIRCITIATHNVERIIAEQPDFVEGGDDLATTEAARELLNTLTVRLGRERVHSSALHPSYLPERGFSYPPIPKNFLSLAEHPAPSPLAERPPYLLRSPEKIVVIALLPDKPPARVTWRNRSHEIVSGIGPERIAPEWWHSTTTIGEHEFAERDYFRVQDSEGLWLWVFRDQRTLQWWMHGLWV